MSDVADLLCKGSAPINFGSSFYCLEQIINTFIPLSLAAGCGW